MKKYLLCCILCLMTAVFFTGCARADEVETDEKIRIPSDEETLGEATELYEAVEEENLEERGELVNSEDGMYQVLIPSGWEQCKTKIDESMLFEIQGETEDQYMGILVLDEATYGELDIVTYMDAYIENANEQYENAVMGEKVKTEVNGHPAYTIKIVGTINEIVYINLVHVVDYESEIAVFTASTYTENETAVTENLGDVVLSFEKIGAVLDDTIKNE